MDLFSKITGLRKSHAESPGGYKLEDRKEFALVRSTLTKYGLTINNFDKNLSSLVISENNEKASYNYKGNIINASDETDDFIHCLFHMASNDIDKSDSFEGCKIKGPKGLFGTSLNEGISDYFTKLANHQYVTKYPYEAFFAYYISKIYGMDIFREHFNGDAIGFYASFKQDETFIRSFVACLDEFHSLSQELFQKPNGDIVEEKQANKLSESFIDCVSEFIRLLQLKKIDENEFLGDLESLMDDQVNDYINLINMSFLFSTHKGKEDVIKSIKEETGGLDL